MAVAFDTAISKLEQNEDKLKIYDAKNNKWFDIKLAFDTDLTANNFEAERKFKMKVNDWLTNGKPKLLRTDPEGNFLVRLLNVSFSPEDSLGRMIHNVSATAYECGPVTHDSLIEFGMYSIDREPLYREVTSEQQILLNKVGYYSKNIPIYLGAQPIAVHFIDAAGAELIINSTDSFIIPENDFTLDTSKINTLMYKTGDLGFIKNGVLYFSNNFKPLYLFNDNFTLNETTFNSQFNNFTPAEYIQEAKKEKLYPISIVLVKGNSTFSEAITKVTKGDFSHSAICLDNDFNKL